MYPSMTMPARVFLPDRQILLRVSPQRNSRSGLFFCHGKPETVQLAVKRGSPDLQPACRLRHLPAIMRQRESDNLCFDLLQGAHVATGIEQIQHAVGVRHGSWYQGMVGVAIEQERCLP